MQDVEDQWSRDRSEYHEASNVGFVKYQLKRDILTHTIRAKMWDFLFETNRSRSRGSSKQSNTHSDRLTLNLYQRSFLWAGVMKNELLESVWVLTKLEMGTTILEVVTIQNCRVVLKRVFWNNRSLSQHHFCPIVVNESNINNIIREWLIQK